MAALQRARAWLWDVFVHHHAERLRTERAVARKAHGVEVADNPYPGSQQNPVTVTTTNGGWLKGAILGAMLLAGGAAGALMTQKPVPASAPSPVQHSSPAPPPEATGEWVITWQNGKATRVFQPYK